MRARCSSPRCRAARSRRSAPPPLAGPPLPDKAIDRIAEAASRLRVSIDSVPDSLDIEERNLTQLKMELKALVDTDRDTLEMKAKLEKKVDEAAGRTAALRA